MEKINIAGLLKDCPEGMELDCTMYDNVTLDSVSDGSDYPIKIATKNGFSTRLTKYGQNINIEDAKCVIFPKGKTTWEGFVPSCKFKDGDIVATKNGIWIGITTGGKNNCFIPTYCVIKINDEFEAYFDKKERWSFERLATEEEKVKLFNAIKANGYNWNAETKTLEIMIEQKFDITTFKPFDKVLVRDNDEQLWTADFFGFYSKKPYPFSCVSHYSNQCIPFDGNEHLLGTTDDCDEFYKTW
jgi:hypothetical protein